MMYDIKNKNNKLVVILAVAVIISAILMATLWNGVGHVVESSTTIIHAANSEIQMKLEECLRYPVYDEVVTVDGVKFYLYFPFRHGNDRETLLRHTPTGAMIACLETSAAGIKQLSDSEKSILKTYFYRLSNELGYKEISVSFLPGLRAVYVAVPADGEYDKVVQWIVGNVSKFDPSISIAIKRVPYGEKVGMDLSGALYAESFRRLEDAGFSVVKGAFAAYNPLTGRVEVTISINDPSEEEVMRVLKILAENPVVKEAGELDVVFMKVVIVT